MGPDVLAVSGPYDPFIANTWVGDVFLNSSTRFGVGGQGGAYDLFSVMLHEAGHVFGIGHSRDVSSPMYDHFNQVRTGLTVADVAALRGLYGARTADALEGLGGNDSFSTATAVVLGGGLAPSELEADVTTHQDADVYRLTVPDGASGLEVRLNAAGFSLLLGAERLRQRGPARGLRRGQRPVEQRPPPEHQWKTGRDLLRAGERGDG